MAHSAELGTEHMIDLPTGRLAYRERGAGPPVVFVHGLLVNADLWRHVVPAVAAAGYRCLAPDWPLGAHPGRAALASGVRPGRAPAADRGRGDLVCPPCRENPGVRRDLRRFLRGVHRRYTLAAAAKLPDFTAPVLLVGAADDRVFPARLADRLAELLPDARRVTVADSYTFVPEDQPAELARVVVDFLRST